MATIAPSSISLFVPLYSFSRIEQGIAKTSLPCSAAYLAVIRLPLFVPASATRTPRERPLIILFLNGNVYFVALENGGYSVTSAPLFLIELRRGLFSDR